MRLFHTVFIYKIPKFSIILGIFIIAPMTAYSEDTLAAHVVSENTQLHHKNIKNQQQTNSNTEFNQSTNQHDSDSEYIFDEAFFQGSHVNRNALLQLSDDDAGITTGDYKVAVYINNQFFENTTIRFIETQNKKIEPCFTDEFLQRTSIITKDVITSDTCQTLEQAIGVGTSKFDISQLRLDLSIPQSQIKHAPRGYVDPFQLTIGQSIGFVNYHANYFYSNNERFNKKYTQDSTYISLNGGINFGKWQYRQQSSLSHTDQGTRWDNIRSYVKRPLTSIQSELKLGQLTSSGRFFSGLSFNGLSLSTDDRMLPDSVRGYAPVVQGVAKSTAKVSIYQNGRELYQTTVAPGTFKISDLYPTSYNGDLQVIVTESDGSVSQFKVPFSAVPESVRQGSFKYSWDIGQTRDIGDDTNFTNLTTQYGVNNYLTINNGLRLADDYLSVMMGTAYTNFFGALGFDTTFSSTKLPNKKKLDGWMFGATYSKTFQSTDTSVALAGYRFSTEGYLDLSDVIGMRKSIKNGTPFQSSTYNERSRTSLTINQPLKQYGSLYLTGSISEYRDEKPDDVQLQLGYGKTLSNGISLNLTVSKQKYAYQNANEISGIKGYRDFKYDTNTTYGLSINFPLEKSKSVKDLNLQLNQSNSERNYQATIHGDFTKFEDFNYNLGANYDERSNIKVINGGINKRFNNVNTAMTLSKGQHYWQGSANVQGALAIHGGGITFGPYLSDTFALVKAKGAQGASILNSQKTKVNRFGYALIPALTPYRYNTISLNPEGMSANTELVSGDTKIAPYSGSSVLVNFNTKQGYPMLIKSNLDDQSNIPFGSEVFSETGENIGLSGQNGQIYFRAEKTNGTILVSWGDEADEKCSIDYNIPESQLAEPVIHLTENCKVGK